MTSSNWPFYYLLSMIVDCEYIRDQTILRLTCGILWWIIVEEVRCRLEAKNNAHFSHISVPTLLWCLSGITFILTKTATWLLCNFKIQMVLRFLYDVSCLLEYVPSKSKCPNVAFQPSLLFPFRSNYTLMHPQSRTQPRDPHLPHMNW